MFNLRITFPLKNSFCILLNTYIVTVAKLVLSTRCVIFERANVLKIVFYQEATNFAFLTCL